MHLIVFLWGFTGILGKLIRLEFYQIVFFRMLIAAATMVLFLKLFRRPLKKLSLRSAVKLIAVGGIVVVHWLTFFKSIQVSTASLAVLCMATTAVHVSWLEPVLMKRKFSWIELILGVFVIFGVLFVSGNIDPSQYEGLMWGLLSGFLAALFAVFNARFVREGIPSSTITFYEMTAGTVILILWFGFQGKLDASFFKMTLADFGWLLFLGVLCTSVAFMLMIDVVNHLGAYTASLTINLEPVYSILLAIVILHENELLNLKFYIGAFFIVLIVFLNPIIKRRIGRRQRQIRMKI